MAIRTTSIHREISRILLVATTLTCAPLAAGDEQVSLRELQRPEGMGALHPSAIARDGTVIGVAMMTGNNIRWLPDQPPKDLGGGESFVVINITPVVDADGAVVIANHIVEDGSFGYSLPRMWLGSQDWEPLPGLIMETSLAMGISADGSQVVGYGGDPVEPFQPWHWNLTQGQRQLPIPESMSSGEAWAVGDDGRVVGGQVVRVEVDEFGWPNRLRFGARWVDGQLELLEDAAGHPVGQVVACTPDCSMMVGGGPGGNPIPHPNQGRAWYWTEATGVVYLDTGGLPAGAMAPLYAMDVSDDGNSIIGTYTALTETEFGIVVNRRPFLWRRDRGARCLIELMAENDIDFGGPGWELVPNSISPDGRMIVLNGMDETYALKAAVLTITSDGIFSNGFESNATADGNSQRDPAGHLP